MPTDYFANYFTEYGSALYCLAAFCLIAIGCGVFRRLEQACECPRIDAWDAEIERYQAMGGRPSDWPAEDDDTQPGTTIPCVTREGVTRAGRGRRVAA